MPNQDHTIIAGDLAVLATRYAGALYQLADDQKELDVVASDLKSLRTLVKESKEFHTVITNPQVGRSALVKTVQQIALSARFHPLTGNFLAVVAQNRRLAQLGFMCDAYLTKLAKDRGEFTAEVRTAHPLSQQQQDQLTHQLQALVQGKIFLWIEEDASLLGGIIVKIGSNLIDASISSKLALLERQLKLQPHKVLEGAA